jgi:hypothetical protein
MIPRPLVLTDRLTEIAGGVTDDRGAAVKEFVASSCPTRPRSARSRCATRERSGPTRTDGFAYAVFLPARTS